MILASNPLFCLRPFEEVLNEIDKNFEGWEFLAEREHGYHNLDKIKNALSTTDLTIQVHAPFNDLNIASMNPGLRQAAIQEIERSYEMAVELDAEMVTMHPGVYSPIGRYWEGTEEAAIGSLKRLNEMADDYGLNVAVENMPNLDVTMGVTPEDMRELLDGSDMPFCLDIGHAYTSGRLDDFLEFEPVNLHIHDNKGEEDVHLPLGEGEIDIEHVMDSLSSYDGNYVIENRSIDDLVESKLYFEELI
ncbi:MAG: sugar phosphate isomerase/epimerase family protein [Thermoplasmatota archaeon]